LLKAGFDARLRVKKEKEREKEEREAEERREEEERQSDLCAWVEKMRKQQEVRPLAIDVLRPTDFLHRG
jgi:actin-related protein 5